MEIGSDARKELLCHTFLEGFRLPEPRLLAPSARAGLGALRLLP